MKKYVELVKEYFSGITIQDLKTAVKDLLTMVKRPFKLYLLSLMTLLFLVIPMRPIALDIAEMQNKTVYEDDEESLEESIKELEFPFILTKPPPNAGRRLTRAEMRWVFFYETRLLAMKRVISDGNERAHRAYSAMVADFNIRGANYEYEFYEKKRAKADIEKYEDEIIEQAKEDAFSWGWGGD